MNTPRLRENIEDAERQIGVAEVELARVIRELRAVPRAEKTISSGALEGAFDKLTAARAKVSELKTLLEDEEGA